MDGSQKNTGKNILDKVRLHLDEIRQGGDPLIEMAGFKMKTREFLHVLQKEEMERLQIKWKNEVFLLSHKKNEPAIAGQGFEPCTQSDLDYDETGIVGPVTE